MEKISICSMQLKDMNFKWYILSTASILFLKIAYDMRLVFFLNRTATYFIPNFVMAYSSQNTKSINKIKYNADILDRIYQAKSWPNIFYFLATQISWLGMSNAMNSSQPPTN